MKKQSAAKKLSQAIKKQVNSALTATKDTGIPFMLDVINKERTELWTSEFDDSPPYTFPEGFLWGAASAAQHVESHQPTDWTAFELDAFANGRSQTDPEPGRAVPGHINSLDQYSDEVRVKKTNYDAVFDQDFELARELNHNAHRFSICWARLFPEESMREPDPAGIQFYQDILDSMKKHGLKPLVSFFHFSSPAWLWEERDGKRGWERDDAIDHFAHFVSAVLDHYGTQIDNWCTLNEPMTYLYNGYIDGVFPPLEQRDIGAVAPVIKRLLEAHVVAYRLTHEHGRANGYQPMVGIAKHTRAFEPMSNLNPMDRITAATIDQAFLWDFLDAIHTGVLKVTGTDFEEKIPGLKGTQDYVGINYYGRFYVKFNVREPMNPKVEFHDKKDKDEVISDLGWAIYPHGFYNILMETHRRYDLPIYILENGMADHTMDDSRRQQFMVTHLKEVWNAINHGGADIRGYMHWSYIDNFEWAEGFTAQFGMIKVDYENDFKRIPKPSSKIYADIIENNGISAKLWQRYSTRSSDE